jgi:hypothetical protein
MATTDLISRYRPASHADMTQYRDDSPGVRFPPPLLYINDLL